MIDWLQEFTSYAHFETEASIYDLDKIREKYEVIDLGSDGYLVLHWCKDKFILNFAVLEFFSEATNESTKVEVVVYGCGPTGDLRELRHTWWGDNKGYIFYPSITIITKAFNELKKYFDLD